MGEKLRPGAEVYAGFVKQAKDDFRATAGMVPKEDWPFLIKEWGSDYGGIVLDQKRNKVRGIRISSGTTLYTRVIHPDGRVRLYHHGSWKEEGEMRDRGYLNEDLMMEVHSLVSGLKDKMDQSRKPQPGIRTLFRRPQRTV